MVSLMKNANSLAEKELVISNSSFHHKGIIETEDPLNFSSALFPE